MRTVLRWAFQRLNRRWAVRDNVSVGADVHIGPGTVLWAPRRLTVADHVYIGKWCTIEVDGVIGTGSLIANAVGLVGRRDHDMHAVGTLIRYAPWVSDAEGPDTGEITIGPDVWIGYGAIVLAPVTIGRGAIIGAGSVVTHDVEPYTIVAGSPARPLRVRFEREQQERHEALLLRRAAR